MMFAVRGTAVFVFLLPAALSVLIQPVVGLALAGALLAVPYLVRIWEAFASLGAATAPGALGSAPSASIIVPAYLPNETDVIVPTVEHLLTKTRYQGKQEVIVVFNTPRGLPVLDSLQALETAAHGELKLIEVPGSHSKAENINVALDVATGSIVAIYDADARPAPDALALAARWLASGFDLVQGACLISPDDRSGLARLLRAEFASKHLVTYRGRYNGAGLVYFGGSNGYWRLASLKQARFAGEMVLEDVECSLRASLRGFRMAFDSNITCYEPAPASGKGLLFQRLRWAYGWRQFTENYLLRITAAPALSVACRLYWIYMMLWRRVVVPAAAGAFLLIAVIEVFQDPLPVLAVGGALVLIMWSAVVAQVACARRYAPYRIDAASCLAYCAVFPALQIASSIAAAVALTVTPPLVTTPRSRQTTALGDR